MSGDKDKAEGAWDKTKGTVKKVVGEVTDNKTLEAEGHYDKAKGSVKELKGDVKNKIKDGLEKI